MTYKKLLLMVTICIWASYIFMAHAQVFDDIEDHTYEEDILELNELDILKWYPDGTFKPDKSVTRAEMMKIILKPIFLDEDIDAIDLNKCFPDVGEEWYAQYICYGLQEWIIKWYPDGTYKPNQPVTYAEAMKIAVMTYEDSIEEWSGEYRFEPFIDYLDEKEIFSKFDIFPIHEISRADVSHMVYELLLESDIEIESLKELALNVGNELQQVDEIKSINSENSGTWSIWCSVPASDSVLNQFEVNWITRNTITVVWEKYDQNVPSKLILAFHGRTNSNAQVRKYYGIEDAWDETGIIVYPSGLPENSSPRSYANPGDASDSLRDFALFDEIVEQISQTYCIDPDQIYVMGHSLWGWFANTLACARWDVIRATWSVWWSISPSDCSWTTSSLIMHHPEDRLAPYSTGIYARDTLLENSMCTWEKISTWPAWWNCELYTCQDDAEITRCPHSDSTARNGTYYPHTRPNGAGELIWEFFTTYE